MLTIQEVADRLRVSVRTVEREIAAGKLRAVKVRRLTRILEPELQGYISRACLSANAPTTGRSVSASVVDAVLRRLSRPAQPAPTRSRSKLLSADP